VLVIIDCQSLGRLEPILSPIRRCWKVHRFLASYKIHRLGNSLAVKRLHHSWTRRKSLQNMSLRRIHDYDDSHLPKLRIQS
jgi:hypothetical protein